MIREKKVPVTNIKIEPADREKNSGLVRQNTETNGLYEIQKLTDYMKYRN